MSNSKKLQNNQQMEHSSEKKLVKMKEITHGLARSWNVIVYIFTFHFEDMWHEFRARVTALLLCVNYQLLQCLRFCFWFVFHHSTTMLVAICAMTVLWWIEISGICLLVVFCVLEFIKFIRLCLSDLGGVSWFFVMVTCRTCFMFLELLVLEVRSIDANGRFWRQDFKKLSNKFLIVTTCAVWFAFGSWEELSVRWMLRSIKLLFFCFSVAQGV
jgi:hypothetical protein